MAVVPENQIPPPAFPIVAQLNQLYTDFIFDRWAARYLQGYEIRKTSGIREAAHNADVGGAQNSAHLHGLARDFQLFKGGRQVPAAEAHQVYNAIIKSTWPGYSQDEIDSANHIHVNLTRGITPIMSAAAAAATVLLGLTLLDLFSETPKKKG